MNLGCSDLDKTDAMLLWGHESIKLYRFGSNAWYKTAPFPSAQNWLTGLLGESVQSSTAFLPVWEQQQWHSFVLHGKV